jgi:hypothetical protein
MEYLYEHFNTNPLGVTDEHFRMGIQLNGLGTQRYHQFHCFLRELISLLNLF